MIQTGSVGTLPFEGTGTFDVAVSSYATATVYGNGNLAVLLHSSAGAVLSLQYDATTPGDGGGSDAADLAGISFDPSTILFGTFFGNFTTTAPQVVVLPSQTSGWTSTASFAQFNPSLGTLEEIILNVGNTVAGTFSAENLESVPATVSMTETASMTVTTPGFASGITASAASADNLSLGAYDGSADFAGPSGQSDTIEGVPDTGATLFGLNQPGYVLTGSTDLAAFTGDGNVTLPVGSAGTSAVTGPANLLTEITQHTGGTVSVSYVYASPSATTEAAPLGPMQAAAHLPAIGTIAAHALNPPALKFIGSLPFDDNVQARPNETFLIGSGASATITDFSPMAGDRLNLTGLLAGVALTPDLANLGAFIRVTGQGPDPNGGTDTTLSVTSPLGSASLTLVTSKPIAVADLLNDNALVLPPH